MADKSWHLLLLCSDDTPDFKAGWMKPTGCDGVWVYFEIPQEYITLDQFVFEQNAASLELVLAGKTRISLKIRRSSQPDHEWSLGSFVLGWDCGKVKDKVVAGGIVASYHHTIMVPRTNTKIIDVDHKLEFKQWQKRKWFQESLPYSVSRVQFVSMKVHVSNFSGGEQQRQYY